MKTIQSKILIEFGPATSAELMYQWGIAIEGLVEYNAHWFADNQSKIEGPLPRYENPRDLSVVEPDGRTKVLADQVLGSAPVIIARGRATCFDWAAFVAGLLRFRAQQGYANGDAGAEVRLIPVIGEYGDEIPFRYHAVVLRSDGTAEDVTRDLPGYQAMAENWWEDHGHCCLDCALGVHAEEQPCEECEVAQAAGCPTGTCGLKGSKDRFSNKRRRR